MNSAVAALRASLDALAPALPPAGPAWATGIPDLDAALRGGIPRGRLTEIVGPRAAGRTTLARRVVAQALAAGRWVAIIDAARTLAPQDWASLGARLVVVRPRDPTRAAWCADRLLRSGVFSLVVLDGAPQVPRAITFRLSQLARDRDAALLVLGIGDSATSGAGGGLRLRILPPHRSTHRSTHSPTHRSTVPVADGTTPTLQLHARGGTRQRRRLPPARRATTTPAQIVIEKGAMPAQLLLPRLVPLTVRLPNTLHTADRRGAATRSRRLP